MSYQVLIQPPAFEEIETAYRWMCDYLSADAAFSVVLRYPRCDTQT
ncbi:hypothetical protein [Microcoleus anatoxicus]